MSRLERFIANIFTGIFESIFIGGKTIFSTILDWTAAMYAEFVLIVMRRIETDFSPVLQPLMKQAKATGKVPPEVKPLLDEIENPTHEIGALLSNVAGGGATGGIISSTLGPWLMLLQYEVQRMAIQQRFDPKTALAIKYRRPDKASLIESDLKDQGWSEERSELLKDVASTRLVEDLLVILRLREIITKDQYAQRMYTLGYEAKEAEDYFTAKQVYPGISDLIRMGVKEAFTPEIAQRFGQYQDLPPELVTRAKQIGLSEEYVKAYWAAHWDLPSAQMGFDMLHRGIIGQDDLKLLLRALDVMPYWRDKLIQLAYTPFTRVDVRRMYNLGILSRDQVNQSYLDIGYSEEKAEQLTLFTIKLNSDTATAPDKALTKAEVVSLYKTRVLPRADAEARLEDLGYTSDDIVLILDAATTSADSSVKDLTLSQVKQLYQLGLRTKLEVTGFLSAMHYTADAIAGLYALWDWEQPAATRLPTRTDFDNFIAAGLIDLQDWSDGYTALGYDMKYQELYYAYLVSKGKVAE